MANDPGPGTPDSQRAAQIGRTIPQNVKLGTTPDAVSQAALAAGKANRPAPSKGGRK